MPDINLFINDVIKVIIEYGNIIFYSLIFPLSLYFVKSVLPKIIDERLQIKIEDIKLQNKKAQYRYELYTQKQHEVFLELYKLFGEAKGFITYIGELYVIPDFTDYSIQEFEEWHNRQTFKMLDVERRKIIIAIQCGNYKKVNDLVRSFISQTDYHLACNKLIDANNFFLANKLYMPEYIINNISDLYTSLNKYCCMFCDPKKRFSNYSGDEYTTIQIELREEINKYYCQMTQDFRSYLENGG